MASGEPIPAPVEDAARKAIGAAIEVHRHLGPGLLESTYEEALCSEFDIQGIAYQRQVSVDIDYKGKTIASHRLDLVVEPGLLLELKAVRGFEDIHVAQVLSYLRATGYRLGLLINFNVEVLKLGIKRIAL